MNTKWLILQVLIFLSLPLLAQQKAIAPAQQKSSLLAQSINCDKILDEQPYFVKHKTGEQDLMLKRDIEILKYCGNFDNIDSAFFKGSILGTLMLDQVRLGKPATYRTLIQMLADFRKTIAYKDFANGMVLYRTLKQKKINLKDWDTDKELFIRMGFTVNDLEDFRIFIEKPEIINMTYIEALSKYMTELEGMRVDKEAGK